MAALRELRGAVEQVALPFGIGQDGLLIVDGGGKDLFQRLLIFGAQTGEVGAPAEAAQNQALLRQPLDELLLLLIGLLHPQPHERPGKQIDLGFDAFNHRVPY